jgi:uncharacterized membrane protein
MNKEEAQRRADRVRAFQEELATVESEGIISLSDGQRATLAAHHGQLLRQLSESFDVDATRQQKQLSWGMRIVTVLGAAAISAAVFFLFYRYWGYIDTPLQVLVLVLAPLLGLGGVELAARRERTGYVATVVALVAFACFVLDLSMLGQVFSITPSQNAFLAWGAFALILAYAHGLALLQVAGILSLLGYLSLTVGTWGGCYWLSAGERPENFIAAGFCIAALSFVPHRKNARFPAMYRLFGLLAVFVAVLILGNWGEASFLPFRPKTVEYLYQAAGFVLSGLAIWAGVRHRWPGTANLGSTFFAIFLYTRFFDWWWEWMPRYLFFLVLGLVAVLLLLILKRLRAATREVTP